MNAGQTSERVYEELKRRILARAFRPGDRLDAAQLGETLASSVTPVRDALHVLVGEGLVGARTGEGFHVPGMDAPGLEDLYAWNTDVLDAAVRAWRAPPFEPLRPPIADAADQARALFAEVAMRSGNAEHRRAVSRLNDRLHAVRSIETAIVGEPGEELAAIYELIAADDRRRLRKAIAAFHRRRRRHAGSLVRALYRD